MVNLKLDDLNAAVESVKDYFREPNTYDLENLLLATNLCSALDKVLRILCLQIDERHWVDKGDRERHKLVIHYTSIAALMSMIQGDSLGHPQPSLRLYDSVHSNDPAEGNYLTRELLKQYKWLAKTDVRHAYIASFILPECRRDMDQLNDNLVFWRTYGHEGEGCSLSLYTPLSKLRRVCYGPDSEDAERTVEELRSVLDLLNPLEIDNPLIPDRVSRKIAETVCNALEKIRYLYKSKAYEHEKECRFVLQESETKKEKIRFEYLEGINSPARIRHYYEHEALQIQELLKSGSSITLGPCVPFRENVLYCVSMFKDRANWEAEIRTSNIIYRKH